jgi:ATP/maltotriose-dependent transcriptional regulator MalT
VPRNGLAARLEGVWERRLTAVIAGAGFGKSTALALWAELRNSAWYSVTESDRDPGVLANGLLAAVHMRVPEARLDLPVGAGSPRGPEAEATSARRATALAEQIASVLFEHVTRPLMVVIDDVNEIPEGGPSAQFLGALLHQTPPELHLVLASRSKLPFPTARLRAQGHVFELSGRHLAFTLAETAALVEEIAGARAEVAAAWVHDRTAGWPAAVRLVAESLRDLPVERWPSAIERAVHPTGAIRELLAEEVMPSVGDDVVALLRVGARFPRFGAGLMDAVGVSRSGKAIADALRRGLVIEVDEHASGLYRISPIVRDFVRSELSIEPDEERVTLQRAARWLADRGDVDAAVQLAAGAGDHETVVRLVETAGAALMHGSSSQQLTGCLAAVPAEMRTPTIAAFEGTARFNAGDWDGALR